MDNNFLQSCLKIGLFDIGDSDDRLKWLQQSIEELQIKFKEDYALLPSYSLVAIDPNITDKEPILAETETIITTYWKALRGKYPDMPRNIIRSVILNALNNVGKSDPIAARIIYLTMLNFFPYAKLNIEKILVKTMLNDLGEFAEKNALEEWSFIENAPSLKLETLKLKSLKVGEPTFSVDQLQQKLKLAIESDSAGHGSNHGGNSSWGVHFVKLASEGIESAINETINCFRESLSTESIELLINKFFTSFKKALYSNFENSFSSLTAIERRSKLLWWKETLYSQSLKKSYRGVDVNLLPVMMAIDLNNQLPDITPISVDFLLKDTLFLLNDRKDEAIKFKDILKAIFEKPLKLTLKP